MLRDTDFGYSAGRLTSWWPCPFSFYTWLIFPLLRDHLFYFSILQLLISSLYPLSVSSSCLPVFPISLCTYLNKKSKAVPLHAMEALGGEEV
jgi:hypothetical protein